MLCSQPAIFTFDPQLIFAFFNPDKKQKSRIENESINFIEHVVDNIGVNDCTVRGDRSIPLSPSVQGAVHAPQLHRRLLQRDEHVHLRWLL